VTVGDDKKIGIWDLTTGGMEKIDSTHSQFVTCVEMDPLKGLLLTGSMDHTAKGWNC
jgi:WD40 repeat protein